MFQRKNEKLQRVVFIFSIINIALIAVALIGMIGILFSGFVKAFVDLVSLGERGGTIQGYENLLILFRIIMIGLWIIACTNCFFTVYSVVEMVKFRTKFSMASSVITIISSIGLSFLFEWTMLPRLAEKITSLF